jgi:DNA repair photolyase
MTHSRFRVFESDARRILSPTSGFIAGAGFTHSLTPARNCTFACTYCYVPTMRVQGGLQRPDWEHWGEFTTFKANAASLLRRELAPAQRIYCSPLVDPYQPAERGRQLMPALLDALIESDRPPAVFTLQTRGPLIVRDLDRLRALARRTTLRISFSIPTERDDVRHWYEPHCPTIATRLDTMRALRDAGLRVHATLAPLLPCDPEALARAVLAVSSGDVIGDPLHVRATKKSGATTREAAARVSAARGFLVWHDPAFQRDVAARIATIVRGAGRRFATGPEAFSWLSTPATT